MRRSVLCVCMALVGTIAAAPSDAGNRWSSMTAQGFTRCTAKTECFNEPPCYVEDLGIESDCQATCLDLTEGLCIADSWCLLGWVIASARAGHWPTWGCETDHDISTIVYVAGTRTGDTFTIDGLISYAPNTPTLVEIALFRFAGDPNVFAGLDLTSVLELVDLGMIAEEDVLFRVETADIDPAYTVDVAGVPDDELVLFGAGSGPTPFDSGCEVPALDVRGAAVLFFVLAAMGGSLVLRRGGRVESGR